jgi:hypothetical protein
MDDPPGRQDENIFVAIVGWETLTASLKQNPPQAGDV